MEEALKEHAAKYKDTTSLMIYSKLLFSEGEKQVSERLLREYAANAGKFMPAAAAVSLLKDKADEALNGGNAAHAKILYDAYLTVLMGNGQAKDAALAMFDLSSVYRAKEMYDESVDMSKKLLAEFPDSELADDASYAIGASLKDAKAYNRAVKAFSDFIKAYPKSKMVKSAIKEVLSIFTVYGKGNSSEKTAAFLSEILAVYPNSDFAVMARFEFASSLESLGKKEDAIREYQYIIDNYPNSEYAGYAKKSMENLRKM